MRAPHVADALLGGMMAAAATALGTLPVLFAQTLPQKVQDSLYGFGAGVMLAASAFSLVAPGIAAAGELGYGPGAPASWWAPPSCWARRCCC